MMNRILAIAGVLLALGCTLPAQVPQVMNYQGRVVVGTTNFDGTGQFRFALVNAAGTTTYWSNDGTSTAGGQPTKAVSLAVIKGLYTVLLGDTSLTNMTASIPPSVFTNSDVRLRVWFNDGVNGSQLLSPDQRIASSGYAMMSGTVADGAITSTKIATGAVGSTQLATGGVSTSQIADNSITSTKIPTGQVVKSLNGLADGVTLAAGANMNLTSSGNTLTLSAAGNPNLWQYSGSTSNIYYLGGNVGLGTSSPAVRLHIADLSGYEARFDGPSPQLIFMDTSSSNALTSLQATAGGFRVMNQNLNNTILTLTSAGYLGLGTTTPTSLLHLGSSDAIRITASSPYITLEDGGSNSYSRIQGNLNGIDLKSHGAVTGSNSGGLIHLDGTGAVGIGTTTPTHQLTILSNSSTPSWTSNGWLGAVALDNAAAIAWNTNSAGQAFGIGHTNGSLAMFRTTSKPGTATSSATYDMVITDTGNIGMGTTGPAGKLQVVSGGDISAPQAILSQTTSGDYARLRFTATGASSWDIAAGTTGNIMNFYSASTAKNVMTLSPNGTVSVGILSVVGGADVAEPFQMEDEKVEKGSVVVIDDKHPGRLKRSTHAYDKRVAGIVSGANGVKPGISLRQEGAMDGDQNVALSGRVYVWADASNGAIEPGDMLTTSDTPGFAMKVTDPVKAQGAVVGKAMSPLPNDKGMVLVLVSLQ